MEHSSIPRSKVLVVTVVLSTLFSSAFGFLAGIVASDPVVRGVVWSALGGQGDAKHFSVRVESNEEAQRIAVVERTGPAVVSIVVSKDVPKLERYFYSPFGNDLFDTFLAPSPNGGSASGSIQVPGYRQNGTEKKEIGAGSGFLVSDDGYIITNKHVVEDEAAEYTVILHDGTKYNAKVLARDPANDIAILKIEAQGLRVVPLGNSDGLRVGQSVIAIGYALGRYGNTVSTGIVSGLERAIHAGDGQSAEDLFGVIQTDSAINPGNSGGPLLSLAGEVIGINVAIVEGSQNISFALPINDVKRVYESVRKTGRIVRPFVGVRYRMIDQDLKEKEKLSVDQGAWVSRGEGEVEAAVVPGSPAESAGIKENDIILRIGGKKLTSDYPLAAAIQQYTAGDEVTFVILRDGKEQELKVTLSERK